MAPTEDFKKGLQEALASLTPPNCDSLNDCPQSASVLSYARGLHSDASVVEHIGACASCSGLLQSSQRHRTLYEMQRRTFAEAAAAKYPRSSVFTQALRPYAWLVQPRALVAQAAIFLIVGGAAFLVVPRKGDSPNPAIEASTSANQPILGDDTIRTVAAAAKSDMSLNPALAVMKSGPDPCVRINPEQVAAARKAISKEPVIDPNADVRLKMCELIANVNANPKTEPIPIPVSVIFTNKGAVAFEFDRDPTLGGQAIPVWTDSARKTSGFSRAFLKAGKNTWELSPDSVTPVAGKTSNPSSGTPD